METLRLRLYKIVRGRSDTFRPDGARDTPMKPSTLDVCIKRRVGLSSTALERPTGTPGTRDSIGGVAHTADSMQIHADSRHPRSTLPHRTAHSTRRICNTARFLAPRQGHTQHTRNTRTVGRHVLRASSPGFPPATAPGPSPLLTRTGGESCGAPEPAGTRHERQRVYERAHERARGRL